MVLVISCHPFSSQRVINPSKEPIKCIISGEWTFLFTIDCGMEIHKLVNSDWCLQFTIQNEGFVEQAVICRKGLYVNIILLFIFSILFHGRPSFKCLSFVLLDSDFLLCIPSDMYSIHIIIWTVQNNLPY